MALLVRNTVLGGLSTLFPLFFLQKPKRQKVIVSSTRRASACSVVVDLSLVLSEVIAKKANPEARRKQPQRSQSYKRTHGESREERKHDDILKSVSKFRKGYLQQKQLPRASKGMLRRLFLQPSRHCLTKAAKTQGLAAQYLWWRLLEQCEPRDLLSSSSLSTSKHYRRSRRRDEQRGNGGRAYS